MEGVYLLQYLFLCKLLVGVGDLINDVIFCKLWDLVGVGYLKIPVVFISFKGLAYLKDCIIAQTVFGCRGSHGVAKGSWVV